MGEVAIVVAAPTGRRLAASCRSVLHALLREMGRRGCSVTLLLESDTTLRRLNRTFRGEDRTTDVLSFPAGGDLEPGHPHLGDIAISVPRAGRQARRAGWTLREEMALLVTHGFLHLLGYDHEIDDGTMRRLEEDLLRRAARVLMARRRLPWGGGRTPGLARRPRGARRDRYE
jgi:probable rRNA maturation factor